MRVRDLFPIALALFLIYSFALIKNLEGEVASIRKEVKSLENSLNEDLLELRTEISSLNSNFSEIEERVKNLEETFSSTILSQIETIRSLRNELEEIKNDMGYYFEWFRKNSNLSYEDPLEREAIYEIEDCIGYATSLPCLSFVNENFLKIKYVNDTQFGREDFIQNLTLTLERGGDCEDIATLFMAEMNHALSKGTKYFISWIPGSGKVKVYGSWYLTNAEDVEVRGREVYLACYSSALAGHCINAICREDIIERIKEKNEVDLEGCYLIEPQNYGALVEIYSKDNLTYIGNKESEEVFEGWLLFMNSRDMCIFSLSSNKWKCFSEIKGEVERILEEQV